MSTITYQTDVDVDGCLYTIALIDDQLWLFTNGSNSLSIANTDKNRQKALSIASKRYKQSSSDSIQYLDLKKEE